MYGNIFFHFGYIYSAFEASLDFSLLTGVPSCNNYSDLQLLISRSRLTYQVSRLYKLLRAGMPDCGSLMPRPGLLRLCI